MGMSEKQGPKNRTLLSPLFHRQTSNFQCKFWGNFSWFSRWPAENGVKGRYTRIIRDIARYHTCNQCGSVLLSLDVLLMAEILRQFIGSLSHYL